MRWATKRSRVGWSRAKRSSSGTSSGPLPDSKVCLSPSFQRRQVPLRKLVGYAGGIEGS